MATPKIPALLDFPEYREAVELRDRISARIRHVRDEIDRLRANRPKPASSLPVEELLAAAEPTVETSPTLWSETIGRLREQRATLEDALKAQRITVRETGLRVAEKIAEQVRPAYAELQDRMAVAVKELGRLADEEAAFRRALADAQVPESYIHPNPLNFMRLHVSDNGSHANAFLEKAEKHHGVKAGR